MDKRTKEYKDSIAKQEISPVIIVDKPDIVIKEDTSEVSELKEQMAEMKTMMQTIGKITANNAEHIKKQPKQPEVSARGGRKNKNSNAYRKQVRPRGKEWNVLRKFITQIESLISSNKQDCAAICGGMMCNDLDLVLRVIKRNPVAKEEALKRNITQDFLTVITTKKNTTI